MNKNRYKLIFSQIKGCLVPVSECINSAMSNGSTDNRPRLQVEEKPNLSTQYALSSLSLLVKSTFNPLTSAMHLKLGGISILCLSLISTPLAIANAERENAVEERQPQLLDINNNDEHIKLSNVNNTNTHNTKLHKTENNVIVIDIATPTTEKQISDNRFEKLNIPKGAVFNNSKKQDRSQLVGYLPANPNLTAEEAKVILNQVTGANQSQIEGALEVLGKRADIVIANQNGITLNGVKTINASRFVATTSGTINPNDMMLNVTQGQVTIGVNGFATDGLPYLDIIAKKIEQKHVIRNQDADKIETEITLVAGSSKYDLGNHKITEQGKTSSSEIAITGSATGAMHGKNIKLIVTDKGAGVKHDGMILSESDIEIALQNGDADLGNTAYFDHEKKIKAKQNVKVTNAKRTVIGNDVEAKQISINAQDLKIRANTELNAHNKATLESQNTISFEEQSKLLSPEITAKATALLDNKGRIYGKTVKLEAESLVNEKEIIAEKELTIDTQGKEISFAKDEHNVATLRKTSPKITAGFVNKGIIESKGDVTLNFKETASFTDKNTKFVKAGKHLKINAKNVELRDQDIQSGANITIDAKESVVQQGGVLASGQALSITAQNGSIYNLGGIFGAGKSLQLTANSNGEMGDIVNQENGLLHTLGTMNLNADNQLYNIGSIYAKNKLSVTANQLLNDVRLSGKISYNGLGVSPRYDISRNAQHGWHVNVYQLNVTLQEQHKADIKVEKMGEIRSDSDFDFQGKKKNNAKTQLINHGLINVKGTLKVNADEVINQMKGFEQEAAVILHKQANIVLRYQPRARYIWTPLAGNAERRFSSLNAFFDALFGSSTILKSSFYSAENFSAYELLRQVKNSPLFSQAMNRVFGAEWHSLSYEDMKSKWKNFKEQPANFIYYPQEKAKILAGSFTGSIKNLQNGEHTEYGSFNGNINIGKHQLSLPSVEFKPEFSDVESLKDEAIELEDILALLDTPNLFIDNSVQFEKEHKNLDKEDLNKDSERPTPPAATENQGGNTSGNTNNEEGEEEDTRDPDETQPEDYVRTDKNVDYLNPDEYFENGYLLNELLQELGEQSIPLEKPLDRASNLVTLSNWERSNGKEQGEMSKKLKKRFREKQKQYKEELKSKAEALALAKAQQQENRLVESKKEAQRQMEDKVAKQQEIRREEEQAAAVREKEKQLEIQIQAEERKQQEEKRVAQEKQQQEEKRKAEEKVAQAQSELEQQQVYEEDVKQEESIAKNSFFKALDATRPKVETDPLYRTKLNYINQDEYVGANYFFNNVSEQNPNQKVKVLGDNYFDHQLITRAIEKKADNHLQQKYNLTDVDLVKKLMDNATTQAKTLHLQLGERLTKTQQAQLTEDIVWYVKTRVNNQDVFVPQVYFASETLAQNPKAQGTGLISATEIKVKSENVNNTGTLSANKLDVEASNKIRNQGSIVSTEETRLVGKKGIENLSRSFANNELGVTVQRAEIKTAGKLHLETDKDSSINVQASDIQAKSAQIRTKELNLKNTHNTKHSYKESFTPAGLALYELDIAGLKVPFVGLSSASSSSEQSSEAISVGSKLAVGDLHLEVEKDINQIGSELTAKQISGVVKGNYNTQAGQNLKNVQKEEYSTQIFASAHASGGGTSVRVDYNSKDGGKTSVGVPTNQTGVGAEAGISFEHSKENESLLTHTNSELQVESGKLTVLGSADIGGVDINTKTSSDKGFELSANDIKSTKQKDQYSKESERTSFKIGPEVEAHSAIADLVSHLAKEYRDAQNGIKQDETVVLQHASDMLNIITGDLAGSSAKLAVERNRETQSTIERSDILTQIGGNVTLSATNGSLALKNVRSDEKTNLTLKAKEDVNILAGEKTKESVETVSRQKLAHGVHAGCGLMSGTCTAGVSTSFEGNESYTHERTTTHSNSLLQGSNIKIEAGGDLNLESSNIDADKVDLNVKGTTNVVSKQDIRNKTTQGFDYNVSAGVALSSATIATPTGTIGGGYTNETETARTVNQQAGIKAKTLTGQVQDLNLQGGYVVSTDESNQLKVKGNITSQALSDQHDKDGGSFGLSVGISERGTSSFNIRGGRSDQKHYQATQKSTLSGVDISQAEIAGSVNTDLSKAKNVTRDDTYASTQFGFEVGDLVELGQKAKNKLRPSSEVDMPSTSSFRSRSQSGEVDSADSASVRNPIYESVETLTTPRRNASDVELVDNPIYHTTPRNRQPTDALPELPNATLSKPNANADGVYAEISNGDYSTVGDRNADTNRSRTRRATDALPELPNVAQPKANASAEGVYAEISNGDY
ncbi:filamentous hemagglutinin N-terminal domain-containing protein, partial [[Haemophilus] felis]|nr:filamentous hemagglutinin N-terminal domain-containing protein [[Haemophilus] felis]